MTDRLATPPFIQGSILTTLGTTSASRDSDPFPTFLFSTIPPSPHADTPSNTVRRPRFDAPVDHSSFPLPPFTLIESPSVARGYAQLDS